MSTVKSRDIALLGALLAVLVTLGITLLGGNSADADVDPVFNPTAEPEAPVGAETETPAAEAIDAVVPAPVAMMPTRSENDIATEGWTSGVIRGHITLDAAIVSKLTFVIVRVREAVNAAGGLESGYVPYVRTEKVEIVPGAGTPEFYYDEIPFSEYGYFVRVFAEGVSGSQQFVHVNEKNKIADAPLSVVSGVPFSVRLRDQLHHPVADLTVFMVPVGEPTGRKIVQLVSDSAGSVVFENVIQGRYEIRVGAMNQSRNKHTEVQVLSHAGTRSVTVEIPRGFELPVMIQSKYGAAVPEAKLELHQVDTLQFRKYEATSDYSGRAVFPFVPAGTYQLNVQAAGYDRKMQKVTIGSDAAPHPIDVRLVPR